MPKIELFGRPWSGYAIDGDVKRFHVNFNLVNHINPWLLLRHSVPAPRENDYRFVNFDFLHSHVRVVLIECDSIVAAHKIIQMAQFKISAPPPEKDRPDGCDFGDVYRQGHWARDNIYLYVDDLSNPKLSSEELIAFQKNIDTALLKVPKETENEPANNPKINEFSGPPKITLKASALLRVVINDSEAVPPDLTCKFIIENGRIFKERNNLFFKGEGTGKHCLKLYVTNADGYTSSAQLEIEVE